MAYCQMEAETFIICFVVSDHEKTVIEHTWLCASIYLYFNSGFTSMASKQSYISCM